MANPIPDPSRDPRALPDGRTEQRVGWFRDAKFGLFIHWGLYAIPAGVWKGEAVPGIGEWIMQRARIPVAEYETLAQEFNPVRFDADAWVRLAKDAGMRYVVITSKHHDGFALFHSAAGKYNVVDATPFGRDILAELAEACARHDMRLGFYYSQAQDWHEPNGAGNDWDFPPNEEKDFDQYLRDLAEPQVREILTQYGPVALIWFDTPQLMTDERANRLLHLVRELQPDCLINGRLRLDRVGYDYVSMPDNRIPEGGIALPWETPATLNDTWGFKRDDHHWKSAPDLIAKLADITAKGGNYLLNVGPTALGEIPSPSVERLRAMGEWLRVNGEAIYGTRPWVIPAEGPTPVVGAAPNGPEQLPFTGRDIRFTAGDNAIYAILLAWPGPEAMVAALGRAAATAPDAIREVSLLGHEGALAWTQADDGLRVRMPDTPPSPHAVVLRVRKEG